MPDTQSIETPEKTNMSDSQDIPEPKKPRKLFSKLLKVFIFIVLGISLLGATAFFSLKFFCNSDKEKVNLPTNPFKNLAQSEFELGTFESEEEFKDYLTKSDGGSSNLMRAPMTGALESADLSIDAPLASFKSDSPSRSSTTNVQVAGIDEPDIVKVSDKTLFTSFEITGPIRPMPILENDEISTPGRPQQNSSQTTKILNAFPPEELENLGGIDKIGNLLVHKNTLVIFTTDTVFGYDISDKTAPKEAWQIPYGEKTQYKDARLLNGEIYLVTNTRVNYSNPCPIEPIIVNGETLSISCTSIYRPEQPVPTDTTFVVFKINAESGEVKDSISFVGSGSGYKAVTYMSMDNLYVTYSFSEDYVSVFSKFITEEASDLFPEEVKTKLERLASYELSNQTKLMEMTHILESYLASLSEDEQMRLESELENTMNAFMKKHVREFESTGLMKIALKNLKIAATGQVPGHPLNQFSLDEYKGDLRVATNSSGLTSWSSEGAVNDVYILNKSLKEVGSVKDLGEDEKIYSVRFIGDKGYVVTFRQVDPFYVLDLSKANNPELKGELKIPGYSSYLHPINEDLILGTGKEGSKVKVALFDVSNPQDPQEVAKYMLDEYWSDILNTHHAFLMDDRHEIFFMPGSNGGYIFSYGGNDLSLVKTVSSNGVKRAVYMDDYLYIIGVQEIVVLDENSWDEVKTFEL